MSKRAAELLRDDLEAKGGLFVLAKWRKHNVMFCPTARRLADEGEIILGGGGEEML